MSRIVCHLDPGPGVMLCVNNYRGAEYEKPESSVDCEDCFFNPENSRLKRDPKDSDKVIYFLKCGICGFSEKSSHVIKVPGIGPVCRKCGSDYMFKEIKKTKKFPAAVVKKNKARNEAKMKQLLYDFDIKQLSKKANELGYDLVKR
jgi:ssDNA-binding Zn-finger/Zn-ribbon topoisomerase 1